MKKVIAIALALSLMAAPASAVTTGSWDMGAAGQSAASAATRLWQEEQKQEEAPVEPDKPEAVPPAEVDKPCLPEWLLAYIRFWKWW